MDRTKLTTRDLCFIGIFTAIIIVMAQISIQMPHGVPTTLQTFAIPLAGIVLGAKRGALSAIIYVLLGAVGVPVFAGFTGGIGIIFGPSGGFILSFPIMALVAGIGAGKGGRVLSAAGLAVGAVINYLCGIIMFILVMNSDLHTAFAGCVLPFIPMDIVKLALAGVIGLRCRDILAKGGLLA